MVPSKPPAAVPKPPSKPAPGPTKPNEHGPAPLHPFDHVRDATYIPAVDRGYAPLPRSNGPRNRAPVESDKLTDAVFDRLFQRAGVMCTPEELLAISPDLRTKARIAVTPKRSEAAAPAAALIQEVSESHSEPEVTILQRNKESEGARGVFLNELGPELGSEQIIVAAENVPLRYMDAIVNN